MEVILTILAIIGGLVAIPQGVEYGRKLICRLRGKDERQPAQLPPPSPEVLQLGETSPRILALPAANLIDVSGLVGELTEDRDAHLLSVREAYREGRRGFALEELQGFCQSESFKLLPDESKGEHLSVLSVMLANSSRLEAAERASEDAAGLGARTVASEAVLAYHKEGPAAALGVLQNPTTELEFHLQLSMLLELERFDEFDQAVRSSRWPLSAETHRLCAVRSIAIGELEQARVESQHALSLRPRWRQVRLISAIADVLSTVWLPTPRIGSGLLSPQVFDWVAIRDDRESRERRTLAQETFESLAGEADESEETWWRSVHLWWLASLLNDRRTQEAAVLLRDELLEAGVGTPVLVVWTLTRDLPFDPDAFDLALSEPESEDESGVDRAVASILCAQASGRLRRAEEIVASSRSLFEREGRTSDLCRLEFEVSVSAGRWDVVLEHLDALGSGIGAAAMALHALGGGDVPEEVAESLLSHASSGLSEEGSDDIRMALAFQFARRSRWDEALSYTFPAARKLRTPPALTLGAEALFESGRLQECLQFLSEARSAFSGAQLPSGLHRLQVICEWRLGLLQSASASADGLALQDPSPQSLLVQLQARAFLGDLPGLVQVARTLRGQEASQRLFLSAVQLVALADRTLAIDLWRRAVALPFESPEGRLDAGVLGLSPSESLGPHGRRAKPIAGRPY